MLVDKESGHTLYDGLYREAPPRRGTFSSYAGIWKNGFHKMKYIQLLDSFRAGTFIGPRNDNIIFEQPHHKCHFYWKVYKRAKRFSQKLYVKEEPPCKTFWWVPFSISHPMS